jgi:CcmD family protein
MRALIRTLMLAVALGVSVAPAALAQDGEPDAEAEDPAEERATAFRAVEGPVTEDVPGGALMIAAYAAIWILVFGYVFRLGRISARTAADVSRLERSLADAATKDDRGEG